MRKLSRQLDAPLYVVVGVLECLWHLAARETPRGDIGRLSNEDIALGIEWAGDPNVLVNALVSCGWIDKSKKYRLLIHDWHDHADEAAKVYLKRKHLTFATTESQHVATTPKNVATESEHVATCRDLSRPPMPLPMPLPMPESEYIVPDVLGSNTPLPPKPEPEEASATPPKALKRPPAGWERDFDALRSAYPARSGDLGIAKARESFAKLLVAGVAPAAIIDGAREYADWAVQTHNAGTQFVKQLSTWLSRRGWEERYVLPPPQAMSRGSPNGHRPEALSLDEQHRQLMADYEAKYGKIGGDDN